MEDIVACSVVKLQCQTEWTALRCVALAHYSRPPIECCVLAHLRGSASEAGIATRKKDTLALTERPVKLDCTEGRRSKPMPLL